MTYFLNEITASDAGPDIIRSHLLLLFSFEYEFSKKKNGKIIQLLINM